MAPSRVRLMANCSNSRQFNKKEMYYGELVLHLYVFESSAICFVGRGNGNWEEGNLETNPSVHILDNRKERGGGGGMIIMDSQRRLFISCKLNIPRFIDSWLE